MAEYWILNLAARVLEVYREPRVDPTARFGWRYGWTEVLSSGSSAAPLVAPGARISVAELLP